MFGDGIISEFLSNHPEAIPLSCGVVLLITILTSILSSERGQIAFVTILMAPLVLINVILLLGIVLIAAAICGGISFYVSGIMFGDNGAVIGLILGLLLGIGIGIGWAIDVHNNNMFKN